MFLPTLWTIRIGSKAIYLYYAKDSCMANASLAIFFFKKEGKSSVFFTLNLKRGEHGRLSRFKAAHLMIWYIQK